DRVGLGLDRIAHRARHALREATRHQLTDEGLHVLHPLLQSPARRTQRPNSVAALANAAGTCSPAPLLRIGALTLPSRLVCAPLAEVTHSAFRRLVAELGGCGLQFTEMLSGRALLYEDLR